MIWIIGRTKLNESVVIVAIDCIRELEHILTVATMHFNFHIHQKLPLVWEKQNGALSLFSNGFGLALNISL